MEDVLVAGVARVESLLNTVANLHIHSRWKSRIENNDISSENNYVDSSP